MIHKEGDCMLRYLLIVSLMMHHINQCPVSTTKEITTVHDDLNPELKKSITTWRQYAERIKNQHDRLDWWPHPHELYDQFTRLKIDPKSAIKVDLRNHENPNHIIDDAQQKINKGLRSKKKDTQLAAQALIEFLDEKPKSQQYFHDWAIEYDDNIPSLTYGISQAAHEKRKEYIQDMVDIMINIESVLKDPAISLRTKINILDQSMDALNSSAINDPDTNKDIQELYEQFRNYLENIATLLEQKKQEETV
jgi:hypothetical protein